MGPWLLSMVILHSHVLLLVRYDRINSDFSQKMLENRKKKMWQRRNFAVVFDSENIMEVRNISNISAIFITRYHWVII
jgi:hypothetical protein